MVETLALRERPIDQLGGSVDRRTFLVAGDEKADRALERLVDEDERGGERGGDPALHVAGAAAPELIVGDRAREGIEAPGLGIARRHDVGMAGEDEIGPLRPEAGVEIVDARQAGRLEGDDLGGEARVREYALR